MAEIHLGFLLSKRQRIQLGVTYSQPGCSDTKFVTPRLNTTVHRRVSPTHQPRNHSGVRAHNMYQEHRHNCKRIRKPKWLESIYYHHRWFFTEIGAAEKNNYLWQHRLGVAPIHRDLTGLLFLARERSTPPRNNRSLDQPENLATRIARDKPCEYVWMYSQTSKPSNIYNKQSNPWHSSMN